MRDIPTKYQKLYAKAFTSRKAAIRSFCLECVGWDAAEVQKCKDRACPLYRWRLRG